jgi:hypothetical protein
MRNKKSIFIVDFLQWKNSTNKPLSAVIIADDADEMFRLASPITPEDFKISMYTEFCLDLDEDLPYESQVVRVYR